MRTTIILLVIVQVVIGKKIYSIPNIKANWYKAYEYCISKDQRLATIESKAESDAVIQFVKNSDKYGSRIRFWIGAGDLAEEGTYTWTSTNKLLTYTIWGHEEPNNRHGNEHCIELYHAADFWIWNDHVCEYEFYFICESYTGVCDSSYLDNMA